MGAPTPVNQSNPTSAPQGKGVVGLAQAAQQNPMQDIGGQMMPQQQMPQFPTPQQQMPQPGMPQPEMLQHQGKGGNVTYPGKGGQPQMGKPNNYPNTVGSWDNSPMKPQSFSGKGQSQSFSGKGQ